MLVDDAPLRGLAQARVVPWLPGNAPAMRRGDHPTDPGRPPDTDPGPEPEVAPPPAPFDPPIDNPDVVALLKGLNASRVAHPIPKEIPTTDGELTATWSAVAHEVPVAHPTPDLVPNVLLNCTEEKPIAEIVAPRRTDESLIDTDPGPAPPKGESRTGDSGAGGVRDRSLTNTAPSLRRSVGDSERPWFDQALPEDTGLAEEGLDREGRVTHALPEDRKRRLGLVVVAIVAIAATIGAAALLGKGRGEGERTSTRANAAAEVPTPPVASTAAPPSPPPTTVPPSPTKADPPPQEVQPPAAPRTAPRAAIAPGAIGRPPLAKPASSAAGAREPSPTNDIDRSPRGF
jgi:hypothetical protein